MGLFDATTDAIQLLDEYLQGLPAKMRKKHVDLKALQKARDILKAVAISTVSPCPIKTFVEEEKGRNHLKAVLTESEHTAWLTLVAQIQAEEAKKKQPKKKNNHGSRVLSEFSAPVGLTITKIRAMTEKEKQDRCWNADAVTQAVCLELSDGSILCANKYMDGTGPGILEHNGWMLF